MRKPKRRSIWRALMALGLRPVRRAKRPDGQDWKPVVGIRAMHGVVNARGHVLQHDPPRRERSYHDLEEFKRELLEVPDSEFEFNWNPPTWFAGWVWLKPS